MTECLPEIASIPFVFLLCFICLFYYMGVAFLAGLGITVLASLFNFYLGKKSADVQKVLMTKQDTRVKVVTELVNNIKILRLNSWVEKFTVYLREKRDEEVYMRKKLTYIWILIIFVMYLYTLVLQATTFSVFIGMGYTLDISVAFVVMTLFGLLQGPLGWLPVFMGMFV